MGVDVDKMRKSAEERQTGGDFFKFEKGETKVLIHPPCREGDKWDPTKGLPYVPVTVHYKVGPKGNMIVSLDKESNPIIAHPWIQKITKKKGIELPESCPMATALRDGTISDSAADQSRAQTRFLWGITPIAWRKSSAQQWQSLDPRPSPIMVGSQIHNGIEEQFFDHGDITEFDSAILVIITKKEEKKQVKYEVKADPASIKKPYKVDKSIRKLLAKALGEDGTCDLFKIVGNMIRSPSEVESIIAGGVSSDPDDFDDDDDDDEDEKTAKKPAKKQKPIDDDDDEDDEDDEDDDDEDDEKSSKKSTKKDDEEDDDEEEEDDEDDDEEPVKSSKKTKKKDDEDDEEDDDKEEEDDEDDDEEEEKPAKSSKKSTKKDDDDEEDDTEDIQDALKALEDDEDDDDEEEEKPAKKSKKGKKGK